MKAYQQFHSSESGDRSGSGRGRGCARAGGSGPAFGFGRSSGETRAHGDGQSDEHPHGSSEGRGRRQGSGRRGEQEHPTGAGREHQHGSREHGRPGSRHLRARRGDVRVAIVMVLAEEPMHGYQIMQRLEERSGGAWRPSPGSVYPTLQLLEDQGLIKGEEAGGRRVFSLSEAGRTEAAALKERAGDAPWGPNAAGGNPRYQLRQAVSQLGAAVKQVGHAGSSDQVTSTLEILREARKRVYSLLADAE